MGFTQHEDKRRTLIEWIDDEVFRSAKVVIVHEEIPIGDHYHLNKDEVFFLLSGMFKSIEVKGVIKAEDVPAPFKVRVPAGSYHKFICTHGSILLGVATQPFDINDERK